MSRPRSRISFSQSSKPRMPLSRDKSEPQAPKASSSIKDELAASEPAAPATAPAFRGPSMSLGMGIQVPPPDQEQAKRPKKALPKPPVPRPEARIPAKPTKAPSARSQVRPSNQLSASKLQAKMVDEIGEKNPDVSEKSGALSKLFGAKSSSFKSGRKVDLERKGGNDCLRVHNPEGDLEVEIEFGPNGPKLTVKGSSLELQSADELKLAARKVHISAEEEAVLESQGSLEMKAEGEIHGQAKGDMKLVGRIIHLN